MKIYGVVVIGCGHIGTQHLEDIYFRENICIEAVVDADPLAAAVAARKFGAKRSGTDYRAFLSLPEVDIVIIATYTSSHLSILQDCIAAGKHVLCEKPVASDLETGRRFFELAKQSKSKVLIAHILRHNIAYQKIREMIASGIIGSLRLMRMVQNHHTMNWDRYGRLLEDCSPIVDCGVHYIDVMQWLSGVPVVEVSGFGTKIDPDAPRMNYGMMTARLADGCIAYYEAGWSRNTASENIKEFIGTEGRISLTLNVNRVRDREEGNLITVYHSRTGEYETVNQPGEYKEMYLQLMTLIDMIENGSKGAPTLDEAYSAFRISLLADEAIRAGKTLQV